jgi:hypothetical protein
MSAPLHYIPEGSRKVTLAELAAHFDLPRYYLAELTDTGVLPFWWHNDRILYDIADVEEALKGLPSLPTKTTK